MGALTDILGEEGVNLRDLRDPPNPDDKLPTNPRQPWLLRELDGAKGAILHHTGGWPQATPEALARMHVNRPGTTNWPYGWPGIAYTFYVHRDYGWPGKPVVTDFCHRIMEWGPHAWPTNEETFGVCLGGNFVHEPPDAEMIMELVRLMRGLQGFYVREVGYALYVKPHFQVRPTKCPGLAWDAYLAATGRG